MVVSPAYGVGLFRYLRNAMNGNDTLMMLFVVLYPVFLLVLFLVSILPLAFWWVFPGWRSHGFSFSVA